MRPSLPVRHFWALRNQRFFSSLLRCALLVERLGMATRLMPGARAAASLRCEKEVARPHPAERVGLSRDLPVWSESEELRRFIAGYLALLPVRRAPLAIDKRFVEYLVELTDGVRSEERRVGKECRSRWS